MANGSGWLTCQPVVHDQPVDRLGFAWFACSAKKLIPKSLSFMTEAVVKVRFIAALYRASILDRISSWVCS